MIKNRDDFKVLLKAAEILPVFEREGQIGKIEPNNNIKILEGCFNCFHTSPSMAKSKPYTTIGIYLTSQTEEEKEIPVVSFVTSMRDTFWQESLQLHWLRKNAFIPIHEYPPHYNSQFYNYYPENTLAISNLSIRLGWSPHYWGDEDVHHVNETIPFRKFMPIDYSGDIYVTASSSRVKGTYLDPAWNVFENGYGISNMFAKVGLPEHFLKEAFAHKEEKVSGPSLNKIIPPNSNPKKIIKPIQSTYWESTDDFSTNTFDTNLNTN